MPSLPVRAWLGSFGLHLTVLVAIGLGSWILWKRSEPTPPPVITMTAGGDAVSAQLPPPLETVEVLPPTRAEAQLVESELELEPVPEGESPLEMWPLPSSWVSDAQSYRRPAPTSPALTRVETEVDLAPPTEVETAPAPLEPTPPPSAPTASPPGPETAARVDPVPDPQASPQPAYPTAALRRGMEGVVVLLAEIDAQGAVTRVRVLESSGYGLLDRAAQDGVAKWRFEPATEGGKPVPGAARVPIRFRLQQP